MFEMSLEILGKTLPGQKSVTGLTRECSTKSLLKRLDDINTLTPVPAITSRDEPWPLFHF